jgi:hypothetical protein
VAVAADVRSGARPETFDGYADVEQIHVGVDAAVYRAREQMTDRPVALKVLSVDGVSPRALEAFARESAVLAALGAHPNIVTLFRSFELSDRRPVLALELCRGSVADRLASGPPFTAPEAVTVAVKVSGALETAHRGGVLHRDVRPANILVTEFGEPALADFGLARLRAPATATAELFDFPSVHVAPELMLGQEPSEATDVYGLASTLYEMLAGQPAMSTYEGESRAATILRILRDPPRSILREGVPIALSDLVLWGLAKDPQARPPTVAWFAEELGRIETLNDWPRTRRLVREPDAPVTAPPTVRRRTVRAPATRPPAGPGARPRRGPVRSVAALPLAEPALPLEPAPPVEPAPLAEPVPPPELVPLSELTWTAPPPAEPVTERPGWPGQVVLRAPLLSSVGSVLALMAPIWAVAAAVVAITDPPTSIVAGTVAVGLVMTVLATWLVRPTLILEACHMVHREGLARVVIPWAEVVALTGEYQPSRRPGAPHGLIVVVGRHATMPLTATRRSAWKLADLIVVLEAFRTAESRLQRDEG